MNNKTILKSLFFTLITLFVLFLVGFIYTSYNLATYQLYYSKHMPHAKGTNPPMALYIDNFRYDDAPELKGYRYDVDGYNIIIKDEVISLENPPSPPSNNKVEYQLSFMKDVEGEKFRTYSFSKKGTFIYYSYYNVTLKKYLYDKSDQHRKEAEKYVNEILEPIFAKLEKTPKINLQWFFNKKYEKRFSR